MASTPTKKSTSASKKSAAEKKPAAPKAETAKNNAEIQPETSPVTKAPTKAASEQSIPLSAVSDIVNNAVQAALQSVQATQGAQPTATKSAALQKLERQAEAAAKKAAAAVKKHDAEDDRVLIQIPADPRGDIPVFSKSYNGVTYKFNAGEMREVPRFVAREAMKAMKIQIVSDARSKPYTEGAGKNMGSL